jgi:hypothetical protein
MADAEQVSPATLLNQLASLDPQERRDLASIARGLSETFAEVPDGKTTSHVLGVLANLLDLSSTQFPCLCSSQHFWGGLDSRQLHQGTTGQNHKFWPVFFFINISRFA